MALCNYCRLLNPHFDSPKKRYRHPYCPHQSLDLNAEALQVCLQLFPLQTYGDLGKSALNGCKVCQYLLSVLDSITSSSLPPPPTQRLYLENDFARPLRWYLVFDIPSWAQSLVGTKPSMTEENCLLELEPRSPVFIEERLEIDEYRKIWLNRGETRTDRRFGLSISLELCFNSGTQQLSTHKLTSGQDRHLPVCTRPICKYPDSSQAIDSIKRWMDKCDSTHNCCKDNRMILPKRVIALVQDPPVLLEPTLLSRGRYIALSHCWGKCEMPHRLVTSNLEAFKRGLPLNELPQNFRDAIKVTRLLQIPYIWIDALCIIQDSQEDWIDQAAQMASIYRESFLTLSALASPNCAYGFLHPRSGTSPSIGSLKDRHFRLRRPRIIEYIESSNLNGRAWTAQERLLSPRLLHYGHDQLYWECASACYSEGMPHCLTLTESSLNKNLLLRVFRLSTQPKQSTLLSRNLGPNRYRVTNLWMYCVEEYSGRALTYISDKMPAVAGLASAVKAGGMGEYMAGLWEHNLHIFLSWVPKSYTATTGRPYIAPTWSWMSWPGGVSFPGHRGELDELESAQWKKWDSHYRPLLVGFYMNRSPPDREFMGISDGSFIVLKGYCYSLQLCPHRDALSKLGFDTINGEAYTISRDPEKLVEQCCWIPIPHHGSLSDQELSVYRSQQDSAFGMQVYGHKASKGFNVTMILLQPTGVNGNVYRRSGVAVLRLSTCDEYLLWKHLQRIQWVERTIKVI